LEFLRLVRQGDLSALDDADDKASTWAVLELAGSTTAHNFAASDDDWHEFTVWLKGVLTGCAHRDESLS
jgi:hypothetical protein